MFYRNGGSEVNKKKKTKIWIFKLFRMDLNVDELMIEIKCNAEWDRKRVGEEKPS